MMIVDLTTIKDSQTSFDFSIDPARIDLESETARVKNAARIAGKIKKGIAQTDVAGEIHAVVEIECSRCLQPTEKSLDAPFSAAFVTAENYTQEKEAEVNLENLEVSIYEGDKIDLSELTREQILLNLPEQIFCRENCKGLCQKCGANRNLIDCNCVEKELDPRWSALKNLK